MAAGGWLRFSSGVVRFEQTLGFKGSEKLNPNPASTGKGETSLNLIGVLDRHAPSLSSSEPW